MAEVTPGGETVGNPDGAGVTLEDILITAELARRRSRAPDYAAENRALVRLAREMATTPQHLPQTLVDMAVDVCHGGTAGISVLKADVQGEYFSWVALAGAYAPWVGGRTPRDFSPCGTALDRHAPQLFADPARYFTYFAESARPPIVEGLVIPFFVDGAPLGTIWLLAHDDQDHFDAEDVRLLTSLAEFTSAALQVLFALQAAATATEHVRAALQDKEVLLAEIHHRVKNNLQVVCSLLNLQSRTIYEAQLQELFRKSEQRIHAIARIHETLYQAPDVTRFDLASYLQNLSTELFQAYAVDAGRIRLTTHIAEVALPLDTAVPCGLVLNELISNALKHAFPHDRSGEIIIALEANPQGHVTLSVRDTGVGLPEEVDVHQTDSLGLQLVCALAEQLQGSLTVERDGSTTFRLTFPSASAEAPAAPRASHGQMRDMAAQVHQRAEARHAQAQESSRQAAQLEEAAKQLYAQFHYRDET
jgi:two-component sensor histidine kinase